MSPLRDNLDRAKAAYGQARYRGNLADDVLGGVLGGVLASSMPIRPRSHAFRWAGGTAIAAAIVVGASVYLTATPSIPTPGPAVAVKLPNIDETLRPADPVIESAVASASTEEADFTLVPDGSSLVGEGASVVPTLASVASTAGSTSDFSLSVPSSPILFSIDALAEQEQSKTTTDDKQATPSEGRS